LRLLNVPVLGPDLKSQPRYYGQDSVMISQTNTRIQIGGGGGGEMNVEKLLHPLKYIFLMVLTVLMISFIWEVAYASLVWFNSFCRKSIWALKCYDKFVGGNVCRVSAKARALDYFFNSYLPVFRFVAILLYFLHRCHNDYKSCKGTQLLHSHAWVTTFATSSWGLLIVGVSARRFVRFSLLLCLHNEFPPQLD
jgi:hypothetical protein